MFQVRTLDSAAFNSSQEQFINAVNEGLSLQQKCLPSWLIFDSEGSKIFKKITELKEYLPAVCEFEIIQNQKRNIAELLNKKKFNLIELGSGDGCKTRILIDYFLSQKFNFHYYPIDISSGAVKNLARALENNQKETSLKVTGLIGDYFEGLDTIMKDDTKQNLVLFLGITLNNMTPETARSFLNNLKEKMKSIDYLLIGFDLMKNPRLLYSAYNDSQGLFQKFNLHLLDRINQELGANFKKENFIQQGLFNPVTRAVESYLFSNRRQVVHIKALNKDFHFREWEMMQTEQSIKFTIEEIEDLARKNGFEVVKHFSDSRNYFVDSVWKVA